MNKRILAVLALGTSLTGVVGAALPAGASSSSVANAPTKGLLTSAQASKLGFTEVVGKPTSSKKTGITGCSKGAEAAYENSKGNSGLISEVLICKSTSASAAVITKAKKLGSASSSGKPPAQLGSGAIEQYTDATTYAIYWQRGNILELLALDVNVSASSSSTTTTSIPAPPLTAQQQKTLSKAALLQDAAAH